MEAKAPEQNLGIGSIGGLSIQKKGSCDTGAARICTTKGRRDEKGLFHQDHRRARELGGNIEAEELHGLRIDMHFDLVCAFFGE